MPHIQYDVFGLGRKYQTFKKEKKRVATCSDGILFLTVELQLYLFCFLNLMTGWSWSFQILFKDSKDREGVRPESRGTESPSAVHHQGPSSRRTVSLSRRRHGLAGREQQDPPTHLTRWQIQDDLGLGVKLRQKWDNYWATIQRETNGFGVCLAKKRVWNLH